ncbi:unannotated protein [freshwater metagenome]|uniref:Unannotated protein n=1 Tax=freshwater metagenome TaxID=449393 RepID=A0A6J6WWT5_9ZZZZ
MIYPVSSDSVPLKLLSQIRGPLQSVPVRYRISELVCQHYASQFTLLRAAGTPIGANDLWIACHALADDCTLVTNNLKEFARVQGLSLENWVS